MIRFPFGFFSVSASGDFAFCTCETAWNHDERYTEKSDCCNRIALRLCTTWIETNRNGMDDMLMLFSVCWHFMSVRRLSHGTIRCQCMGELCVCVRRRCENETNAISSYCYRFSKSNQAERYEIYGTMSYTVELLFIVNTATLRSLDRSDSLFKYVQWFIVQEKIARINVTPSKHSMPLK